RGCPGGRASAGARRSGAQPAASQAGRRDEAETRRTPARELRRAPRGPAPATSSVPPSTCRPRRAEALRARLPAPPRGRARARRAEDRFASSRVPCTETRTPASPHPGRRGHPPAPRETDAACRRLRRARAHTDKRNRTPGEGSLQLPGQESQRALQIRIQLEDRSEGILAQLLHSRRSRRERELARV